MRLQATLLWLAISTSGCAGPLSARMQVDPAAVAVNPDPANATVVFLRPGGGGANAIIAGDGTALGEPPKGSKLVVTVPPGSHTFFKGMYTNQGAGEYKLFGPEYCTLVQGTLEAGKIYAVEASLVRLFVTEPSDPRLAEWAKLPSARMTTPGSVASDPVWSVCQEMAQKNAAKDNDGKSMIRPDHGLARWP